MRGARRIEGGERKVERGAQARFAVVAGAMAQQIGPPVVPVGGQAAQVGFALRIGGKQLDRQRMAVERAEEAGQGGVGGEMIAGVAQEQGARIGVLKLFDVSQRARAGARKFWRLAANGDDEPEAVDGGEPAQKRLSRGNVFAPGRFQIVENRQRRLGGAGGGDLGLHFGRRARCRKAEIGRKPGQGAFGVRRWLEIDEKPPLLAEARDDA